MDYDVIIIGSGPAGYVAAIRAGQVGLKTALIEKKQIGGMCLNWGCIPTKSLIESAKFFDRLQKATDFGVDGIDLKKIEFNWLQAKQRAQRIVSKLTKGVEYLLNKNGVEIIIGEARINADKSITVNNRNIEAPHVILATGSYPRDAKLNVPEEIVQPLDQLLALEELPQNIVLFGHGPHIAEIAQFFNKIKRTVTMVMNNDHILPDADRYLSDYLYKKLKSDRIKIIHADTVDGYEDGKLIVGENKIDCDLFLNINLRAAILPPSEIKIETDEDGFISTNDNLESSIPNFYAVGDVNGRSYLAHTASAQGIWVVNKIKGIKMDLNLKSYPLNIYTTPEMAQIGKNEQELQKEKQEYKVNEFPLSANGKALSEGYTEGLVRLLSDKKYGHVLGVQIIAEHATDMIAEASAWMQIEGTIYDIAKTIHAHPTVSEIFMEAGFDAVDKAIHK